ncbi:hypothetical protein BKA64DRAFT_634238 [Cadophora sp. MPI-SDFR-AT-0126]|nr:hypothetical protein BKA64DRAFT_634238 [Leotiomycetes sp. MPI-SDFR-AT-0126]
MFRMDSIKSALRAPFVPKLTTEESSDLPTHIAHTRANIFELERRINVARTNLLTISRCMKDLVSRSSITSEIYSGTFGVFDLPRAIADLEDLLRQKEIKRRTTFPAQLIDRPVAIPDSERTISPPRSLSRAYIAGLRMSAEGSYHLLKVKRQGLKIELDRLEADVKRWGDIYARMTSSSESQEQMQTTPALSTSTSFSSQSTLAKSEGDYFQFQIPKGGLWTMQEYENLFAVKRKAVPVEEIVSRTLQRANWSRNGPIENNGMEEAV